jgi:hypothetical protein
LTILAGSPKAGKSVVTTQMAIAVADGRKFLGEFQAKAGHVLWYDVDDGDRYRTQKRLEDLGQDLENENIVIHRKLPSIPDGPVKQIEADLESGEVRESACRVHPDRLPPGYLGLRPDQEHRAGPTPADGRTPRPGDQA